MFTIKTIEMVDLDAISSSDLRQEGVCAVSPESEECTRKPTNATLMAAYSITIGSETDEYFEHSERAEAIVIYADHSYRLGVAWGGDATWGDVRTDATTNADPDFEAAVVAALRDWLTDPDAWEARN